MLIILEGPDGAGKTTLAERIVTYLGVKFPRDHVQLIHKGPPTRHPLDEYAVPLLRYRPGRGEHMIIDRWHWGEMIYPKYLARKTKMTREIFTYIEMLIIQRGGVVVNMLRPADELLRRLGERGDDLIKPEWLEAIAWDYQQLDHSSLTGEGLSFDPFTVDPIVDYARKLETDAHPLHRLITPVATERHRPRLLLMGDVRNCRGGDDCEHRTRHYQNGTAFMPYPATSGAYLLKALGVKRGDRIALANAADDDMPSLVWDKYDRPPIVALGVNASRALKTNGVPHSVVPHPQHVRRFHYTAAAEYGRLIWSCATDERNELKWRPSPELVGAASTPTS